MNISSNGIILIKTFEGCSLQAYQDTAGVWTIGYGWTGLVNGEPVKEGMSITRQQADELLVEGIQKYESGVRGEVTVNLTQWQYDALISFTYNVGIASFTDSTLLKKLNAGQYQSAADEFLRWHNAGGEVVFGLILRRAYERDRFLGYTQ
ncbi:muraminidase [Izhakiella australiensis]|uniref:Lysozyme n=1 Tax=Izhakiella australiensis TaxID=1926881 RepID=A0A1S8YLC2_9GAMM|nr:lysozyme [Izhakiella australiensis]OON39844.1 muraminidase [Izhakiella australiensis]